MGLCLKIKCFLNIGYTSIIADITSIRHYTQQHVWYTIVGSIIAQHTMYVTQWLSHMGQCVTHLYTKQVPCQCLSGFSSNTPFKTLSLAKSLTPINIIRFPSNTPFSHLSFPALFPPYQQIQPSSARTYPFSYVYCIS